MLNCRNSIRQSSLPDSRATTQLSRRRRWLRKATEKTWKLRTPKLKKKNTRDGIRKSRILLTVLFYVDIGLKIEFQFAIKLNINFIIDLEPMHVCLYLDLTINEWHLNLTFNNKVKERELIQICNTIQFKRWWYNGQHSCLPSS